MLSGALISLLVGCCLASFKLALAIFSTAFPAAGFVFLHAALQLLCCLVCFLLGDRHVLWQRSLDALDNSGTILRATAACMAALLLALSVPSTSSMDFLLLLYLWVPVSQLWSSSVSLRSAIGPIAVFGGTLNALSSVLSFDSAAALLPLAALPIAFSSKSGEPGSGIAGLFTASALQLALTLLLAGPVLILAGVTPTSFGDYANDLLACWSFGQNPVSFSVASRFGGASCAAAPPIVTAYLMSGVALAVLSAAMLQQEQTDAVAVGSALGLPVAMVILAVVASLGGPTFDLSLTDVVALALVVAGLVLFLPQHLRGPSLAERAPLVPWGQPASYGSAASAGPHQTLSIKVESGVTRHGSLAGGDAADADEGGEGDEESEPLLLARKAAGAKKGGLRHVDSLVAIKHYKQLHQQNPHAAAGSPPDSPTHSDSEDRPAIASPESSAKTPVASSASPPQPPMPERGQEDKKEQPQSPPFAAASLSPMHTPMNALRRMPAQSCLKKTILESPRTRRRRARHATAPAAAGVQVAAAAAAAAAPKRSVSFAASVRGATPEISPRRPPVRSSSLTDLSLPVSELLSGNKASVVSLGKGNGGAGAGAALPADGSNGTAKGGKRRDQKLPLDLMSALRVADGKASDG